MVKYLPPIFGLTALLIVAYVGGGCAGRWTTTGTASGTTGGVNWRLDYEPCPICGVPREEPQP